MKKILMISVLLASLPLSVACNSLSTNENLPAAPIVQEENQPVEETSTVSTILNGSLSDQEIDDLRYMREEEKLAHDVYIALYERWGLNVFQNIASSEQTHTNSVQLMLDSYGIADPTIGLEAGQFNNTDLQALYDQLVAQGSQSLADALKVGAAIEEIDILDLMDTIEHTGQADILRVYENLLKGSYNHLRAFTSSLSQQTGETYQPQYLTAEEYQTIIDGSMGNGMSAGSQGQPGGRGPGNPNRN